MIQGLYRITENTALTESVYRMTLQGDTSACTAPGQFVNIKLDGFYLRRPISLYDWEENRLTILYKVVGRGTEQMARLNPGEELDLLTGLGNGYDTTKSGDRPILIGGGVGIPPLYALCKKLLQEGKCPSVILGFNKKEEVFCKEDFEALLKETGGAVYVTLAEGLQDASAESVSAESVSPESASEKSPSAVFYPGFVTDVLEDLDYTYFYTCGPAPMFQAIEKTAKTSGQFSFEERMGCGFGACMGCSCKT
ncbi:MAG TPA: dihydroorotate dehydrogenase electron transfer subunit, partial [Clostridiales bacterium]|nr:dihydroorotate dehydrogenase electron transfer subunit [Clostridiales bacterium]